MADIRTVLLNGTELMIEGVCGSNVCVKNKGKSVVYAAANPNVEADKDGVLPVDPGEIAVLPDCKGTVYLLGTGRVIIIGTDKTENYFNPIGTSEGSVGSAYDDTISTVELRGNDAGTAIKVEGLAGDYATITAHGSIHATVGYSKESVEAAFNQTGTSNRYDGCAFAYEHPVTLPIRGKELWVCGAESTRIYIITTNTPKGGGVLMTVQGLLQMAREHELAIQADVEHLEHLHRIAKLADRRPSNFNKEILEKINSLEKLINNEIDKAYDAKRSALVTLSGLEGDERVVLTRYYILGESWEKISEKTYMSTRKVYYIRKKAIEKLERRWKDGQG